jgi:L-aminopeptidase/D-esterase-like protein
MKSLSIGHITHAKNRTGVTVFLLDQPATASYVIPGSAPASRELAILDMGSNNQRIDALVFSGGSAFGLVAADGVMQWLRERGRGIKIRSKQIVPIVPAVAIYDLNVGSPVAPTAEDGYKACESAKVNNLLSGRIGAGTGASVGKLIPNSLSMTGGFGISRIKLKNGLEVVACAVVNAIGNVYNQKRIIAGAKSNGVFIDYQQHILRGKKIITPARVQNTTLIAVFTNAQFSKEELNRVAKMAIAGMAKTISPIFTWYDGDVLFCISIGRIKAHEMIVGSLAVQAVSQAIINAVQDSVVIID